MAGTRTYISSKILFKIRSEWKKYPPAPDMCRDETLNRVLPPKESFGQGDPPVIPNQVRNLHITPTAT